MDTPESSVPPAPGFGVEAPPVVQHKKIGWEWFVGLLYPLVAVGSYLMQPHEAFWLVSTFRAYYSELANVLVTVMFAPMYPLVLIGLGPLFSVSVAGFGLPSPVALIFTAVIWAGIGRAAVALYRWNRVIFVFAAVLAVGALAYITYVNTTDIRLFEQARNGNLEACDKLGDLQAICIAQAAAIRGDKTICDRLGGPHLQCTEDAVKPTTYQQCFDIWGHEYEYHPGDNNINVYACLTQAAQRTGDASLCNYPHSVGSGVNSANQEVEDYHRTYCIEHSGSPEVPMTVQPTP